jgi:hypothetical protein
LDREYKARSKNPASPIVETETTSVRRVMSSSSSVCWGIIVKLIQRKDFPLFSRKDVKVEYKRKRGACTKTNIEINRIITNALKDLNRRKWIEMLEKGKGVYRVLKQ